MNNFETRLQEAKQLIAFEHTARFMLEHDMRVTPLMLSLLGCITCKNIQGIEASVSTIQGSNCVTPNTIHNKAKLLAENGLLTRTKLPRDSSGGQPRYQLDLTEIPVAVRHELIVNRPCGPAPETTVTISD